MHRFAPRLFALALMSTALVSLPMPAGAQGRPTAPVGGVGGLPAAATTRLSAAATTRLPAAATTKLPAAATTRLMAQQGLAIALASNVLQDQLQLLLAVVSTGPGCSQLKGGGSWDVADLDRTSETS